MNNRDLQRWTAAFLILPAMFLLRLTACAQSPPPTVPAATNPPGIFGVGFTTITDSSARLVFTTSEPMTSTVVIYDGDKEFSRSSQPDSEEIHAVDLTGLSKGKEYQVTITGVTAGGQSVTSDKFALTPSLRPPSPHKWPGYTIFSSTVNGPSSPDNMDVLTQSGARMERLEPSWSGLFPKGPEVDQKRLDNFVKQVADLKAHNIEPLVILDYCVPWAQTYTKNTMTWRNAGFGPPDNLADWEQYVRTLVTALHGSAKYYEVWNEPDAGYLATGSFVERPNLPAPIGRAPFKDNWAYWIGDRYAPMIERVRTVMDEIEPDAVVMNGGWNHDYSSTRGNLLFDEGIAPYLDAYAFHTYCGGPISFARWYGAIDGGFRTSIDRNFGKHQVQMPLAVTEWGWPAWADPHPDKGFVTFEDAQKFYLKTTFYFLAQQRFEVLSQFCMGIGSGLRDKDPSFFTLVDRGTDGKLINRPTYDTFRWLATTFSNKPYQAVPVTATPADQVKAYAIQLKESGDAYLAVWQDGVPDAKGAIPAQPARDVAVSLQLPDGNYSVQVLDPTGAKVSESSVTANHSLDLKVTLPEISATAESGIYLAKIAAVTK